MMMMRQIDGGEAIKTGPGASVLLEEIVRLQIILLVDHRSWLGFQP